MQPNNFANFGEILDELLKHFDLMQIDLTKIYGIEKSSISTDRASFLTRRKMMKYRKFMKHYGISEDFILRGNYPILQKQNENEAKLQRTIDDLLHKIETLEAVIEERGNYIESLQKSLDLCIKNCGDPKKKTTKK